MTVPVLDKMEGWRSWTADVEDYTEETMPGIRADLDMAKNQEEEVAEVDMDPEAWSCREMIWRFLKKYTSGEARKVVCSAPNRNGWEAWRKLHLQYEPQLVMREAVVMAAFTNMVAKRAKTPVNPRPSSWSSTRERGGWRRSLGRRSKIATACRW